MTTLRGLSRTAAEEATAAGDDTDTLLTNLATLAASGPSAPTGVGTLFWLKKTMVSSAILSSAAVDLTGVSSVGELAIEDVILKTDSTGLAAGTAINLLTNNVKGLANFMVQAVSGLGANKTVDLAGASGTKIKTVLETGKKIQIQATVADCTGAGTIDVYILLRRLTAGATIAAA